MGGETELCATRRVCPCGHHGTSRKDTRFMFPIDSGFLCSVLEERVVASPHQHAGTSPLCCAPQSAPVFRTSHSHCRSGERLPLPADQSLILTQKGPAVSPTPKDALGTAPMARRGRCDDMKSFGDLACGRVPRARRRGLLHCCAAFWRSRLTSSFQQVRVDGPCNLVQTSATRGDFPRRTS